MSNGVTSWRTALRYLARGPDRASRVRLAVLLVSLAAYDLSRVLLILVLARMLL